MKKLKLKNGKEVNLEITYGKLFEFQRNYVDIAKSDLVELITKKELMKQTTTVEHETIVQIIYVAYLGGKNEEPTLSYEEFLNEMSFDFKRDLKLFGNLTNSEKN